MQPLSQWSMEITTLCTIVASLRVVPNRSQFFMYESVALSCAAAAAGRVRRNTSHVSAEECGVAWGKRNESHCVINDLHALDTGAYWCEAGDGGACGPEGAVNIAVTGGSVILESPVLPVQEGQSVTLRCTSETPSSAKRLRFYKDGVLLGGGGGATGNMTIRSVSKSDEGLYGCDIIGVGESLSSWLAVRGVRAGRPESSRFSLACILLPVVAVCLLLASTAMLLRIWSNRKGKVNGEVSYADVTIAPQEVPPKDGENENSPTFYSTIKA